jgi:hypothetical protein
MEGRIAGRQLALDSGTSFDSWAFLRAAARTEPAGTHRRPLALLCVVIVVLGRVVRHRVRGVQ